MLLTRRGNRRRAGLRVCLCESLVGYYDNVQMDFFTRTGMASFGVYPTSDAEACSLKLRGLANFYPLVELARVHSPSSHCIDGKTCS